MKFLHFWTFIQEIPGHNQGLHCTFNFSHQVRLESAIYFELSNNQNNQNVEPDNPNPHSKFHFTATNTWISNISQTPISCSNSYTQIAPYTKALIQFSCKTISNISSVHSLLTSNQLHSLAQLSFTVEFWASNRSFELVILGLVWVSSLPLLRQIFTT